MPDLLETLAARGLLHDATADLAQRLQKGPLTAYVGFDPTSDSLHVGSLVPVIGAAWLQRFGHTPIVLIGGGTGMVGDPSGKRSERPILPLDQIDRNAQAIRAQLARFLSFDGSGSNSARLRNNADWLRDLPLMDFLREAGRHLTLGFMLQKDSVRSRLESGISYTEFSYMAIQAYDFWHLFRTEGCELQVGGGDQWGNITAGIELVRKREGQQLHGLVFPLITNTSGAKFGKSEAGNIWLDPAKTSPYQFYQFWINTDDRDVERYLKLFTFLSLDEIAETMAAHASDPGKRAAQRLLAADMTTRVHGAAEAEQAMKTSRKLFGGGVGNQAGGGLGDVPERRISRSQLRDLSVVDLLVASGLATSKADARRGIQGKGFYLNDEPIETVDRELEEAELQGPADARFVMLRKGKKNYVRLVIEP
ncbi:MAG: tyrosyl-tRNA synthetase [Gemmatimonadales bacterium]|jgi:tyrosyl-tRNA synthetase|nr:tyrosyl-tRNA synthetase [Gemmatimonadales bacterium]